MTPPTPLKRPGRPLKWWAITFAADGRICRITDDIPPEPAPPELDLDGTLTITVENMLERSATLAAYRERSAFLKKPRPPKNSEDCKVVSINRALAKKPLPLSPEGQRLQALRDARQAWLDSPNVARYGAWLNREIASLEAALEAQGDSAAQSSIARQKPNSLPSSPLPPK